MGIRHVNTQSPAEREASSPVGHGVGLFADQGGQTLPLIVTFLVVLIGVCGLVIDLGDGYFQRQSAQNEADAAALAGAMAIPAGTYQTTAQQYATDNGKPGDTVSVTSNGTDTVTVTVSRSVPTYLLSLFGRSSIGVSASATATVETVGQVSGHVSPYAVTVQAYANGTGTKLFQENSPGAYGTIDLPTTTNTTGGSCTGNTNLGTPTDIKSELSDQLPAGLLTVSGCLSVKGGASQPSANVINTIPSANNTMNLDLQNLGNGEYQVIPQPWDDSNNLPPRLMYVPIVQSLPGGNGNATIVSFAWFYMTNAANNGSNLTINGQFVTLQLPPTGPTYKYQPGVQGQVITAELTG
jgi:Flp pilus assembly protein TadG